MLMRLLVVPHVREGSLSSDHDAVAKQRLLIQRRGAIRPLKHSLGVQIPRGPYGQVGRKTSSAASMYCASDLDMKII